MDTPTVVFYPRRLYLARTSLITFAISGVCLWVVYTYWNDPQVPAQLEISLVLVPIITPFFMAIAVATLVRLVRRRPSLEAGNDVMVFRDYFGRRHVRRWKDLREINQSVAVANGSGIHYLNFVSRDREEQRDIKFVRGMLDRSFTEVVDQLVAQTGARAVPYVQRELLYDPRKTRQSRFERAKGWGLIAFFVIILTAWAYLWFIKRR